MKFKHLHFVILTVLAWGAGAPFVTADTKLDKTDQHLISRDEVTYELNAAPGSFVFGSLVKVDQALTLTISSGGKELRHFSFTPGGDTEFSFVAESSAAYHLVLTADQSPLKKTDVKIDRVLPMDPTLPREKALSENIQSPTLKQLALALPSDQQAESDFWQKMKKQNLPLIERLDDENALYTFLWQGTDMTRSVDIYWPLWSPDKKDNMLKVIAGTNVWFKTVTFPLNVALSYKFVPNAAQFTSLDKKIYRRAVDATAQRDPLNKNYWKGAGRFEAASLLRGPKAAALRWSVEKDNIPKGKVENTHISSKILGNSRKLSLYLPATGQMKEKLPLVIIFDGERYLKEAFGTSSLDNLISAGKIPPVAAVFVYNTVPSTRAEELPCNPKFANFLADELIPFVREKLPATRGGKDVIAAGFSFGGLASTCVNYFRPEVFNHVLSLSGSYWWYPKEENELSDGKEYGWMIRAFERRPCRGEKYFFNAGKLETGHGMDSIARTSERLAGLIKKQGCDVNYSIFPGGHDLYHWRETLADGLIWLLGKPET